MPDPAIPRAPAGWYPDPEKPAGPRRWWNGQGWAHSYESGAARPSGYPVPDTAHLRPPDRRLLNQNLGGGYATHANTFPPLGVVTSNAWQTLTNAWRPLAVIAFVGTALPTTILIVWLYQTLNAPFRGDAIVGRDSGSAFDPSAGRVSGFWIIFLAVYLCAVWGYASSVALLLNARDAVAKDGQPASLTFDQLRPAMSRGARRTLPLIGWALVVGAALLAAGFASVLLITAVNAVSTELAVVAAVILFVAVLGSVVYFAVRWAFIGIAIVDAPGSPLERSGAVTEKRFWPSFAALLVLGLLGGAVAGILNQVATLPFRIASPPAIGGNIETTTGHVSMQIFGIILMIVLFTVSATWSSGLTIGGMVDMYRAVNPADPERSSSGGDVPGFPTGS